MASLTYELTLAGLAVGSAAALSGIGLIVTYRATGVLNLAHGAVAMVCAYVLRQLVVGWHWPVAAAGAVTLLLVAPGIGLVLDRLVFRPLAVRGGDTAAALVASIGVFVLLVGLADVVWGAGARTDAPVPVGGEPWPQLAAAVLGALAVALVTRRTGFGRVLRAVVDDRVLAELGGVDADRVAAAGWAFGTFTAGLTGVLLAPYVRLDPYGLPLLVLEVVAVVVLARLKSLPVAIGAALAIGVAQSQLTRFHPTGWAAPLLGAVSANLFAVALLAATLLVPLLPPVGKPSGPHPRPPRWPHPGPPPQESPPHPPGPRDPGTRNHGSAAPWCVGEALDAVGQAGPEAGPGRRWPKTRPKARSLRGGPAAGPAGPTASSAEGTHTPRGGPRATPRVAPQRTPRATARGAARVAAWSLAGVLLLLPLGFGGADLAGAVRVPAFAVVLLSLVVVTGRGGQISLGQAAYAGLGALFTALLAAGRFPGLPPVTGLGALAVAVLLVAPLGLLTGWPAIRRRGLALALATLAFGVAVSRFVFAQPYATAGLELDRPPGFADDRAYYALELGLLAASLVAVAVLRRGRPGRALAALRDDEAGAAAAGVAVPRMKLLAFVAGAALAALGGGMLGLAVRAFDPETFDPVRGLLWFAAVVVLGADSAVGALIGAALLVGLDAGTRGGVPAALIGVLAVLVGRFPAGLAGLFRTSATPGPHPPPEPPKPPKPPKPPQPRPVPTPTPPPPHPPSEPPTTPLLSARGLHAHHGPYHALRGVALDVPAGRITGVVGANGAGKSTLFDCLGGALRPTAGRVLLDGRDITHLPPYDRARLGLARSFQQLAVFDGLTVEDNVRLGAEQGHRHDPGQLERSLRLLRLDGPLRYAPAAGLSTATLRRVELARALAGGPRVLLLDEPAAGLDATEVRELTRVLRALAGDGLAVLVVEHDPDVVGALADTVHTMAAGVFLDR
ncbi:ATP-binding cassette domain-containing protein [Streptomyces sp. NPDC093225]|uniref:ABC transporter permease subunit n=1 Tax=Streptomyces sp. NPDC093225 TaxID=3366034 RepID=UPI00380E8084